MDREIRNLLERTTQQARRLLEAEYGRKIEGTFDILPDGTIHLEPGGHLTAEERFFRGRLVAAIEHRRALGESAQDSVANFLRECAFTFLNRIVALRMLEARGIIKPSVSKGEESSGFTSEFLLLAPGLKSLPDQGYRLYLESLFDEIGREVGVLFDRTDLAGQLWPDRPKLLELLNLLDNSDLESVWGTDEAIGWVYQYFNSDEERRKMRKDSQAPQNSREMAVRNQFFTPRYVVEFLTDNTLGRLWYEMRQGETALRERCLYLVRRPNEIFLQAGDLPPDIEIPAAGTQDELLREPTYVPYRALKDPREIRVLDPACGSGHFLLYCFDLLEVIYEEAWDSNAGALKTDYPEHSGLKRAIPELILRHNLHGIDIDPRAAQIGSLALWMRAQRSWQETSRAERPPIRRTNIVIAEPMPGEADLLDEFCERLQPNLLGQLVRDVFERMRVAGDAGALLRIESDIAETLAEARRQWEAEHTLVDWKGQSLLFAKSKQTSIFEVEEVSRDFWEFAEERLIEALHDFASATANGRSFRRRLFVEDAERGFAFIDTCRKRFDVTLMNPPFGDASLPSKDYIDRSYGDTKGDVYKAFVEGSFDRLLPSGMLGIISSRNGFFANQSSDWRNRVVRRLFRAVTLADFGDGVLDAAVSTAAYVLRRIDTREESELTLELVPVLKDLPVDRQRTFSVPKYQRHRGNLKRHQANQELSWLVSGAFIRESPGRYSRFEVDHCAVGASGHSLRKSDPVLTCLCLLLEEDKAGHLLETLRDFQQGRRHALSYLVRPSSFDLVPTSPFAYWVSDRVRRLFEDLPRVEGDGQTVKQGLATAADFRFVRCWWELNSSQLIDGKESWHAEKFLSRTSEGKQWVWFGKGGGMKPFCSDLHLVVNYGENGREIKAWAVLLEEGAHWSKRIYSTEYYFRSGLTFGTRLRRFGVVPFPQGAIFGHMSPLITSPSQELYRPLSVYLTSNIVRALLGLMTPPRKNEVGYVANIPTPLRVGDHAAPHVEALGARYGLLSVLNASRDETHARFTFSALQPRPEIESTAALFENGGEVDRIVATSLGLGREDQADLLRSLAWVSGLKADNASVGEDEEEDDGEQAQEIAPLSSAKAISLALGCVFGRWDVRQWLAKDENFVPQDPYAPLPICPPGSLKDHTGMPARVGQFDDTGYPITIAWSGILVDEEHHGSDICGRTVDCLALVLGKSAHSVEEDICREYELAEIREYFRNPRHLFQRHLDQYFKSRRRAPIFWQFSVPSKRYSVWIYYHRLSRDTFWRVLNDFVKPKLQQEERRLAGLRTEADDTPTLSQRRAIQDEEVLVAELTAFRDDIETIAPLWNPDLNDGVLLNFAPLWKLAAQLPSWQRELRDTWQELCQGEYDWSHLAMHLWPERVVPKCATDRSLAIAHGIDKTFWEEQPNGKWKTKKVPASELKTLIEERTSKAVKAALDKLQAQSASAQATRRVAGAGRRNA
jgi:hypothetical protein